MQKEEDHELEKLRYLEEHIGILCDYLYVHQDINIVCAVSHFLCAQSMEEELLARQELERLFACGMQSKTSIKSVSSLRGVLEQMGFVVSKLFKYHCQNETDLGNFGQVVRQKEYVLNRLEKGIS